METLLLKPMDVAEHLGISKSKVYELLASGELPSIRIGKSIGVSTDELRNWISERKWPVCIPRISGRSAPMAIAEVLLDSTTEFARVRYR